MRAKGNELLGKLIYRLKKSGNRGLEAIAEQLERPRKNYAKVNIYKIEKYAKEGENVFVPGKVLSEGELKKNVKVYALSFSKAAKEKLGDKAISLYDLEDLGVKVNRILR